MTSKMAKENPETISEVKGCSLFIDSQDMSLRAHEFKYNDIACLRFVSSSGASKGRLTGRTWNWPRTQLKYPTLL
jgi:hypothetical protein